MRCETRSKKSLPETPPESVHLNYALINVDSQGTTKRTEVNGVVERALEEVELIGKYASIVLVFIAK